MSTTTRLGLDRPEANETMNLAAHNDLVDRLEEVCALDSQTVNPAITEPAAGNTLAITALHSWIVKTILGITGAANWFTAPAYTLAKVKAILDGADAVKLPNAALAADVHRRANLLINGGFELWQRGEGPFTISDGFCADGWRTSIQEPSVASIQRTVSTVGSEGYSCQINYARNDGGFVQLDQRLEGLAEYKGKALTITAVVKSNVAGSVKLQLTDYSTYEDGAYNVGTGKETLTVSKVIDSTALHIHARVVCDVADCQVEVNDLMMVIGEQAVDYVPLPRHDEELRCFRFYEVRSGQSIHCAQWAHDTANGWGTMIEFKSRKVATPSVTKVGTWAVSNCNQPTIAVPSVDGYKINTISTTAVIGYFIGDSADDLVIAEANL